MLLICRILSFFLDQDFEKILVRLYPLALAPRDALHDTKQLNNNKKQSRIPTKWNKRFACVSLVRTYRRRKSGRLTTNCEGGLGAR